MNEYIFFGGIIISFIYVAMADHYSRKFADKYEDEMAKKGQYIDVERVYNSYLKKSVNAYIALLLLIALLYLSI